MPTVLMIGRGSVIKFVYSNPDYKVRRAHDDSLAAAQAAATKMG